MGDIKRQRKRYDRPVHPWQKPRIEMEKEFLQEYGLKNKKEIYKINSVLKRFKDQVKALTVREDKQAELERQQLMNKLLSLGLLQKGQGFGAVLGLGLKDILERRLQTFLVRKGMARSMGQARQFIVHRHVMVNNTVMTVPGYLVRVEEQNTVEFTTASSLYSMEHPERIQPEPSKDKIDAKPKKEDDRESRTLTDEEKEAKEIEKAMTEEVSKEEPDKAAETKNNEKASAEKSHKNKAEKESGKKSAPKQKSEEMKDGKKTN